MEINAQQLVDKIYNRILDKGLVMIEISARHVHLTQDHLEQLFGKGYQLTYLRELSQPGQYLCKERVSVTGPSGTIQNIAILGPCRNLTQIELSGADARKLGIEAPVRISGNTKGTPGAVISAGNNSVQTDSGVIIAKRHIHMHPKDAQRLNLHDKDIVDVQVLSERPLTFEDTEIRVSEEGSFAMHIDIEEANAAGISKLGYGLIKSN